MRISKQHLLLFFSIYLIAAFYNLGRMYFQHEEPRRAIIALEMNYTHDYATPHVLGRDYFRKPPLHNIVIALFFKIFGENEFSARAVSVLSMFGILLLILFSLKDAVGLEAAIFGAFSFGLSYIAYFHYGMLAETDMFFSFLLFASMVCIFHEKTFTGSVFAALALLTKGLPALHYFYLTLISLAILRKNKSLILSKNTILGGLFIVGLFLGWLLLVSKGDIHRLNYALGFILQASGNRVLSIERIRDVVGHFLFFPVSFFIHYLPFSATLLLFLDKRIRLEFREILKNETQIKRLFDFFLAAFIPNFLVYAILPDGRIRYTLVLFGIASFILGILYYELEYLEGIVNFKKLLRGVLIFEILLFFIGFIFCGEFIKNPSYIGCIVGLIIAITGLLALKKDITQSFALLLGLIAFSVSLKFLFETTYKYYLYSYYTNYRNFGHKIAKIVLQERPKYVMTDDGNLRLFFYLERDLKMQMHPISKTKKGLIISRHKNLIKYTITKVELPDHIYYVGRN
ncbi:ArnT family glycosyltransferase [Hippea maritima]|uniref:Glycosyl transferase family 39 n=1 Tax=Hippea maritima (strain ATCC 700847 / DSM 10411 / MH2) TaxID=760142 RepID=F2LTZ5_HIPMA|nr:glycosyltransferase family 39 protein [Hippea maritima]AEA33394.1 glycosyl transferase family 39 [Hippea maritima DSM 10411]